MSAPAAQVKAAMLLRARARLCGPLAFGCLTYAGVAIAFTMALPNGPATGGYAFWLMTGVIVGATGGALAAASMVLGALADAKQADVTAE